MAKTPFNFTKPFNPATCLHWEQFASVENAYSLEQYAESLAYLHPNYEKSAYFKPFIDYLRDKTPEQRLALQRQFLQAIHHDQLGTIYPAVIHKDHSVWLQAQIKLFFSAALQFARDLVLSAGSVPEFMQFIHSHYPKQAPLLESVLKNSLLNYSLYTSDERYRNLLMKTPLYAECGVDILLGEQGPLLAELQFCYQSYPQGSTILRQGYETIFGNFFKSLALEPCDYQERRLQLLRKTMEIICKNQGVTLNDLGKYLIDAWATLEHATRNYKKLAEDLSMTYLLFDYLFLQRKLYPLLSRQHPALFIFNQPLLPILDQQPLFAALLHKQLEIYPDLGCNGLLEDYLNGKTFLTSPPVIEILNDKALYAFLPQMVEYYHGTSAALNVTLPEALWDLDNPLLPDTKKIAWLHKNKDQFVICHRYLESGDGIKVGKYCSSLEWTHFITTYVNERPYLFVVREYYPMSPDLSLRSLVAGLMLPHETAGTMQVEISQDFLGRINLESSAAISNSFFLAFTSK